MQDYIEPSLLTSQVVMREKAENTTGKCNAINENLSQKYILYDITVKTDNGLHYGLISTKGCTNGGQHRFNLYNNQVGIFFLYSSIEVVLNIDSKINLVNQYFDLSIDFILNRVKWGKCECHN